MRQRTYGLMASCLTVLVCMAMLGCSTGSDDSARVQALEQQVEALQAAQEKQEKEEPAKTEDPTKTGTTTGKTLADTAKTPEADTATTTPPLLPTTGTTTPSTTSPPSAEDVKRAHGLLAALPWDETPDETPPVIVKLDPTSDLAITVENSRIKIESGFFKSTSGLVSLPGFHGVLLEDTLSPSGNFTETWAIYTDIETTRGVLEHHYNEQRVAGKPSEFAFRSSDLTGTYTTTTNKTADLFSMSGIEATKTTTEATKTATGVSSYRKVNPTNSIFNLTGLTGGNVGLRRALGESFSATFRGVSGSYTCMSSSDCTFTIKTVDLDHDNDPTTAEIKILDGGFFAASGEDGDWTFKAGSQPQIAIPGGDEEFMYFGWWISTPDSAGGTYAFEPRLGGMGFDETPSFIGTARYTGPATGMYVKQNRADTVESDGELLTVASSGVFTGDATLVASSDGVSGSVRNFKEGGQSLGDWTVLLLAGGGTTKTTTLQVGDSTKASAGDWNVEFVSSRVVGENPVAAVGYFDAELAEVLHLSGAFGANRQSPK